MIQIKNITPPTVEVYNPENGLLITMNEYELLDLRVQIKKEKAQGYYIKFNGEIILINRNGDLSEYPEGLLDTMTNYLLQLI